MSPRSRATMSVFGSSGTESLDAVGRLAEDAQELDVGEAADASAILLIGEETVLRDVQIEALRSAVVGGAVVFVDAWGGDEAWLTSIAPDGKLRPIIATDSLLVRPHALAGVPPAHADPDATLVGVESRGEIRVVATRQNTLCHDCSCGSAAGRIRFGENLARLALDVALRSRTAPREEPVRIAGATLHGRNLRAEAVVRNDTGHTATAWLRLMPREGPVVAEASKALVAGESATVVLETELPVPFDVVEHRIVVSREDVATVDREVAPLVELAGAPDLVLLHAGEVAPGLPATVRVLARNSRTGEVIAGSPFVLTFVEENRRASTAKGTTDSVGTAALSAQIPSDAGPWKSKWTATVDGPLGPETATSSVRVVDATGGHLFLDSPIHRPGDVVRFRLLALRQPTGTPAADREVEVSLLHRSLHERVSTKVTTDGRGVASGELRIPATAATGDWELLATGIAGGMLRVERFETPRFHVVVDAATRQVRPGGVVSGAVIARRFDDTLIANADVSVVLRSGDFSAAQLARWEGTTDASGRATYRIDVPRVLDVSPDAPSRSAADVMLDVRVMDAGGRSVRDSIRLAWASDGEATGATVHTPGGALVTGRPGTVLVRTDLASGAQVQTTVDGGAPRTHTVDDFGFVSVDVATPTAISTIVVGGRDVSPGVTKAPLTLSVGHRLVQAGATIPVRAVVSGASDAVFVDILWRETIVAAHRLRVVDGVAAASLPLPAGVTGRIVVQAYVAPTSGGLEPAACAMVVVPPETLRMSIVPSASDVRPGDTVGLDVQVSDMAGRGVPSAFALRVVDEAVTSLVARPMDVARLAVTLGQRYSGAATDASGLTVVDLAAAYTRRALTTSEARLADVLLAAGDHAVSYRIVARSLPARREAHLVRVTEQFRGFSAELRTRAAAALEGELSPAPSDDIPDVVAALRVAAARGAFGPDGLVDPWGTPLLISGGVRLPLDSVAAFENDASTIARSPILLRSHGPDASSRGGRRSKRELLALEEDDDEIASSDDGDDDCGVEWSAEATLELHARWVRRHGHQFDEAEFTQRTGFVGSAGGGTFGGRRGGHRSLTAGGGGKASERAGDAPEPRTRRFFPDAILFTPLVVTDADGRARVNVATPDSVTTWHADGVAHDGAGGVAQGEARFRATLPFVADADAPAQLFVGDEVEVPVVLRWTSAARSDVAAEATVTGPLQIVSPSKTTLRADARGEAALFVRVRAIGVGVARITVRCRSGGASDAVEREIDIRAPGVRTSVVSSFRATSGPTVLTVARPTGAVAGTERVELRLLDGPLAGVLDGVEGLLRTPHGCFEQASSTLFPNILALTYLERSSRIPPSTRAQFDAAIRTGTDLLLTYEIPGGGFDWFGHPPAKLLLTAYGAHEWWMLHRLRRADGREDPRGADGAGAVAMRTTRWLVSQQRPDGSFPADGVPYDWRGQSSSDVAATAYVGWALTHGRKYDASFDEALTKARAWVVEHAGTCNDPYALALVTLFLTESGSDGAAVESATRLAKLVQRSGTRAWLGGGRGSAFYGRGAVASVEATALAALAAKRLARPDLLDPAEFLASLAHDRREDGTWGTTHATVLSLWALLDAAETAVPAGTEVIVRAAGLPDRTVAFSDESGVSGGVTLDLSGMLATPGPCRVTVQRVDGGPLSGMLAIPHVKPWLDGGAAKTPFVSTPVTVWADFPKSARIGERSVVLVEIRNVGVHPVEMPIVVIPLPAGFSAERGALRAKDLSNEIARTEIDAERVVIYLRTLAPGASIAFNLPVTPRLRGRITAAPAEARPYYEPDATWRAASAVVVVE
ncbi:MAG: hypothetical protein K8T90_15040 [Planctomycetes bacterium]|nr:hypothetical protein [Planctomycetota bacterium]